MIFVPEGDLPIHSYNLYRQYESVFKLSTLYAGVTRVKFMHKLANDYV